VHRCTGGARHTAITQAHLEEREEMAEKWKIKWLKPSVFTLYNRCFGGNAVGSMDDNTMKARQFFTWQAHFRLKFMVPGTYSDY
jgi:hypothetical protein